MLPNETAPFPFSLSLLLNHSATKKKDTKIIWQKERNEEETKMVIYVSYSIIEPRSLQFTLVENENGTRLMAKRRRQR